jgi:transcriptional regulator with XRE-family HTH domain
MHTESSAEMTPETYRLELGRRIRLARTAAYPRGRDFAAALEIDPSQLSRLENGQRSADTMLLRRIVELLRIPLEQIVPHAAPPMVLARDRNSVAMEQMVEWARLLQTDIDVVSRYAAAAG